MKKRAKSLKQESRNCYCGNEKPYSICCEPFHLGKAAPTAEALMRSRYSAYVLGLEDYLLKTHHPETRPATLNLDDQKNFTWLGLTIKRTEETTQTDKKKAIVEFVARYKVGGGRAMRLHEISEFEYLDRWFYKTGSFLD